MAQGKPVYILMVSNPVDILTRVALETSGLPKERVFGTGTALDTARLRVMLANNLHVSQQSVQAYVMGEHGDSSLAALSHASIAGIPLEKFPGFAPGMIADIEQEIRNSVYKIIEAKRSTYYGIGTVVAKIIEAMQHDTATVYPACSLLTGQYGMHDVVLGLPSLISRKGVQVLDGYPLNDAEHRQLEASAAILRQAYAELRAAL